MGIMKRLKRQPSKDLAIDKVVANARYCLNSPEGQKLLEHLIEESGIDCQVGFAGGEEAIYINGKQDMMKYLSLIHI